MAHGFSRGGGGAIGGARPLSGELDRRQVSVAMRIDLAHDTACALTYLHARTPPIVHGDIKGSNVLVERSSPGRLRAKLLDFGLSRTLNRSKSKPLGGTRLWMAPEAAQKCRPHPHTLAALPCSRRISGSSVNLCFACRDVERALDLRWTCLYLHASSMLVCAQRVRVASYASSWRVWRGPSLGPHLSLVCSLRRHVHLGDSARFCAAFSNAQDSCPPPNYSLARARATHFLTCSALGLAPVSATLFSWGPRHFTGVSPSSRPRVVETV